MWRIFRRVMLPLLVLAVGVVVLVHGVKKHTAHVFEEQEIEITIAPPPTPFLQPGGPPGFGGPPGMGGMPGFDGPPGAMPPFGAPPPELRKVKQKIFVGKDEPEMAIVRDVTIGGLVLLDSGDLRRTYSGQPPSLCPT
jgi:hypothetical protein